MKNLFLFLCLFPLTVWADYNVEIALGNEGESWKIERTKLIEGKETSLNMGKYLLKISLKKSEQENGVDVNYALHEPMKGDKYKLMAKGSETIENKGSSDITVKVEEPKKQHPIISIKFKTL